MHRAGTDRVGHPPAHGPRLHGGSLGRLPRTVPAACAREGAQREPIVDHATAGSAGGRDRRAAGGRALGRPGSCPGAARGRLHAVQVVAMLSLKGGVGKTTVALGLAGAALQHGLRSLIVDLDPQANATIALDPGPTTATIADVLDEPTRSMVRRAVAPRVAGGTAWTCWSAPSRPSGTTTLTRRPSSCSGCPARCVDSTRLPQRVRTRRRFLGGASNDHLVRPRVRGQGFDRRGPARPGEAEPYRLVILDCPPSLGQLTRSALAAAHRAVLVTDPTMFAVSGVQRAFEAVQTERQRGNPDLQPLGVFVNRVRPRNSEHEFRIAELRELFGPLVLTGVLPDRSAIQQAQGACLPIQRWDTPGAREVSAVFTLLLGRILRSDRPRRTGEPASAAPVGD